MNIEQTILGALLHKEDYSKKVFPFLKQEYFDNKTEKTIFCLICEFVEKYNKYPTPKIIALELLQAQDLSEQTFNECKAILSSFHNEDVDVEWLTNKTEEFCKERALHNAIKEAILIIDNPSKAKLSKTAIPEIVTEALAVSFTDHIGHDFFENAGERWDYFNSKEEKIPFGLHYFNLITRGGLKKKTLNIIIAGTGVGKSYLMCQFAADNLMMGKNVLYITLEMSSEEISKRIDANLLDMNIDDVHEIEKEKYLKLLDRIKKRTSGTLIVEEYPTSSASVLHFKTLINDLKIKKGFIPDIIYVDYLGICASSRLKLSNQVNSYLLIKAVAEELRGVLAKGCDCPVVSAVQFNRTGFKTSDPTMSDTSESFGVPFTADLMLGLISSEELEALNQLMVVQFKNRYNSASKPKRFVVGTNRDKMKIFDLEESAQKGIADKGNGVAKETQEMEDFVEEKKKPHKSELFEDFV